MELTEHPNGPHAHQSPNVWFIRRKYKIEGESSAEQHRGGSLHLEHRVESRSGDGRVLGGGGSPRGVGRGGLLNDLLTRDRAQQVE